MPLYYNADAISNKADNFGKETNTEGILLTMANNKKIKDSPIGAKPSTDTGEVEVQEPAYELSEYDKKLIKANRRRNILLGSIFLVGTLTLGTVFFVTTSQNTTIELSSVGSIVGQNAEVASFDSEWFANAIDIVLDDNGIGYFSNSELHKIYKLDRGSVTEFAGTGVDDLEEGNLLNASFASPTGLSFQGNAVYVADQGNHRIRKIDLTTGDVTTVAGSGPGRYALGGLVDGAIADARFNGPMGVTVDSDGTIYVADTGNNAIRKISGDTVSTLAGGGNSGDAEGTGSAAKFNGPRSVAILDATNLLVADTSNNKLKIVNKTTGETKTFAGNGSLALKDGTLLSASFYSPSDVLVTQAGNIFIADTFNHAIRVIPRSSNNVYILTGNGEPGFKDGKMSEAIFDSPISIVEERDGAILVVDAGNKTIRRLK